MYMTSGSFDRTRTEYASAGQSSAVSLGSSRARRSSFSRGRGVRREIGREEKEEEAEDPEESGKSSRAIGLKNSSPKARSATT